MMKRLKEDIEELLKHNIEILPLNNVRDGKNTRKDFGEGLGTDWIKPKRRPFKRDNIYKALEEGILGYFIRTGKRAGYFIVDIDNQKESTNEILSNKILNDLLKISTFHIKTPKGYHFFFNHTEYFKVKTLGVLGNIDIITNENIVFFGVRDDGLYQIQKSEKIDKIPKDIKNVLLEQIQIKEDEKRLKELSSKATDIHNTTETPYIKNNKYFINDDELLNLLKHLPSKYNDDVILWVSMSSILKKAGFKEVWDEWSKSSKKYNKTNNETIFKRLNVGDEIPDLNYIINILNDGKTSKKEHKLISKIYKPYMPLHPENIETIPNIKIRTINEKYLSCLIYENGRDYIIKSSLGTGKTYSVFEYILKNNLKILSICQLINNVDNHIRDFGNHIPHYEEDYKNNIDEISLIRYDEYIPYDTKKKYNPNLCSTIDSLCKVYERYFKNNEDLLSQYVVFLDEIHSDLLHLLTSSTLTNKRVETLTILCLILKKCKQIIMTDGNICDVVLKFYKDLKRMNMCEFIHNTFKSFDGVNVYLVNKKGLYTIIDNNIKNNTFFHNANNTKSNTEDIAQYIQEKANELNKTVKIRVYTSTEGEKIRNIEEEWDEAYKCMSPSIISGLDFKSKIPEDVIVCINEKETINAEQICQQICRNRNIRNVFICASTLSNNLKYNSLEELEQDYKNKVNSFYSCSVFKELSNKSLIGHQYKYDTNDFTELLTLSKYHNNVMSSNPLYYIYEILTSYGFIFHNKYEVHKPLILKETEKKEANEKQQEQEETKAKNTFSTDEAKYEMYCSCIKDNEEVDDNKYNNQLRQRLELINIHKPKENTTEDNERYISILEKYESILNDPHAFNNHLTIRHFIKKYDILKAHLQDNNNKEFKEHLINQKIPKLLNMMSLMEKYFKHINIYKFEYNDDDDMYNEKINMTLNDYGYIKHMIQTKKEIPKTKRELLSILTKCYKNILGDEILKKERFQMRIEGKKRNFNKITFNDTYFRNHMELLNHSLEDKKSKQDIYHPYIYEYLEDVKNIKINTPQK